MRLKDRFRQATASCLLALLGALSTGLPSHSHDAPAEDERGPHLVAGDQHSHGTLLVEQDVRVQAAAPQLPTIPATAAELTPPVTRIPATDSGAIPRPNERAPPPGAPRAPPFPA